jgi:hypothetical protein
MSIRRFALGLVILTMVSCSSTSAARGPVVGSEGGSGVVREIVVDNNVSVDIQVSAVVGSRILAMGTVRANSSRSVRLPNAVDTQTFRLMAEPRGNASMANRIYSEPIPVSEANNATWEIRGNTASVIYGRRGTVRP